eukprot:11173951-Lingulodinium_polyedra.AAC.1
MSGGLGWARARRTRGCGAYFATGAVGGIPPSTTMHRAISQSRHSEARFGRRRRHFMFGRLAASVQQD